MKRRSFIGLLAGSLVLPSLPKDKKQLDNSKLYFVRNGYHNDPKCWSRTPNGQGGDGIPDSKTDIIITRGQFFVREGTEMCCSSFFAGGSAILTMKGTLTIYNDATFGSLNINS